MGIYRLDNQTPRIDDSAYIADTATVIGDVVIGHDSSVWSQSVLRADNEPIEIGDGCNIHEGAVLHTDPGFPIRMGDQVSVGHQAMLHGCAVGEGSLIGIQAIVMNGAVIGRNCLVGAGAVVTEGKTFPDNSLILGVPAKVVRQLADSDAAMLVKNAEDYVARSRRYKTLLHRLK